MQENALKIQNLSFAYKQRKILKNLSFTIKTGEFTVLLGPNGAGKSTILALITQLLPLQQGTIHIANMNMRKTGYRALRELGVVFQQAALDLDLTIEQNLSYHCRLHGFSKKDRQNRIKYAMEAMAITNRRKEKLRQLNGGHRRRVEIARAYLHTPRLLLLDEATTGLDIPTRQNTIRDVHEMANHGQTAVLWITHLEDEAYENDRLLILSEGVLHADGIVKDLLQTHQKKNVAELFSSLTRTNNKPA